MKSLIRAALVPVIVASLGAGEWSAPADAVGRDGTPLVTCRARLAGEYLLVEVTAAEGWHVYAMDNELRAKEALAGKMSLGVEENTEVTVTGALQQVGDWFQREPQDFSQPALRWFSYGFEGTSLLATRVRRVGGVSATITVRAQACDSASCIRVDAELDLPLGDDEGESFSPEDLVRVRTS